MYFSTTKLSYRDEITIEPGLELGHGNFSTFLHLGLVHYTLVIGVTLFTMVASLGDLITCSRPLTSVAAGFTVQVSGLK